MLEARGVFSAPRDGTARAKESRANSNFYQQPQDWQQFLESKCEVSPTR
jgi:hypothetical protein